MIRERKANANFNLIPNDIHIVEDSKAIRILGAWFGNDIPTDTAWPQVLEKIDLSLKRWEMSHPSVPNQQIIIQTVLGGLTQYLTTVQGMPKLIEDFLEKREWKFIWESRTKNLIILDTLKAPRNQGGLDILDIKAHNKAIEVMWIKELLSEEKLTWTYFAHDIIGHQGMKAERNICKDVKSNIFLQSFNTKKSLLPQDLQRILNVTKETGVRVEGITFSREILRSCPIWYHSEASPRIRLLTRSSASICLRDNHELRTVGEAEEIFSLLDDPQP